MATWVTHLMIADSVMKQFPGLDRRGFCVGNIAPDCNVENEDWTVFTPPREVTHWMLDTRKTVSGADTFCEEYIQKEKEVRKTKEQYAFLLGYYAHLLTDAAFQAMVRDEDRIRAVWGRIHGNSGLHQRSAGMEENWNSVRLLIPKKERMHEIYCMEAEYLRVHPDSGYLTEILTLKEFPDYIDYLPQGCIVRKIRVMGYLPELDEDFTDFITISREEYASFVGNTIRLVTEKIRVLNNIQ